MNVLLALQVLCCIAGLYARYALSFTFYDGFHESDKFANGMERIGAVGAAAAPAAASGIEL